MKDNQNKRRKLTDEQVEQMLARAVHLFVSRGLVNALK